MNEIIKRWCETGQLQQEDIIPILLEYNQLYGDGKATVQECNILINSLGPFISNGVVTALKRIALKLDGQLTEVYSKEGILLKRFWYENKEENEIK